jgi:hypothetical protein
MVVGSNKTAFVTSVTESAAQWRDQRERRPSSAADEIDETFVGGKPAHARLCTCASATKDRPWPLSSEVGACVSGSFPNRGKRTMHRFVEKHTKTKRPLLHRLVTSSYNGIAE